MLPRIPLPEPPSTTDERTEEVLRLAKNALIIGGTVLAAYAAYRLLTNGSEGDAEAVSEKPAEAVNAPNAGPSPVLTAVKGAVVSFLLEIARERLAGVIAQFNSRSDAPSRT